MRALTGEPKKATHEYLSLDLKCVFVCPFSTRLLVEKTEIGKEGLRVRTKENTRDGFFECSVLLRVVLWGNLVKLFDLYDHAPCRREMLWSVTRCGALDTKTWRAFVEGNLGCIKELKQVYGYPIRL